MSTVAVQWRFVVVTSVRIIGTSMIPDTPEGGDLDSTEIRFRRMRAEDHHPRKTDGNQHNCEHAARSRSVKPCERPLRSACGPELDVIQAGWLLTVASNVSGEIFRGWRLTVFPSLHVRRDTIEAD